MNLLVAEDRKRPLICLCADCYEALHPVWSLRKTLDVRVVALLLASASAESFPDGVQVLVRTKGWSGRVGRELRERLREMRPDVVHLFGVVPEAIRACRLEKIPVLYSPGAETRLFTGGSFFRGRRERRLAGYCRALLVESDLQEERLLEQGVADEDRVIVIPGWVSAVPPEERRPGILGSVPAAPGRQEVTETAHADEVPPTLPDADTAATGEALPAIPAHMESSAGNAAIVPTATGTLEWDDPAYVPVASDADVERYSAQQQAWREKRAQLLREMQLPVDARYVGLVWPAGERLQQRYLEMASRLCRLVKNLHVLVAGVDQLPPVHRRTAERDLAGVLHLLPQPREREFYLPLEVFVHCGAVWGTPKAILAALTRGVSVVAEECPGLQAAITPGENGVLIPGGGWAAMATAAAALLGDEARLARFGAWGELTARERFSREAAGEAYARLYACASGASLSSVADCFYGAAPVAQELPQLRSESSDIF